MKRIGTKQGFMLLELMVYLGTSILLCMVVFSSALALHRALLASKTVCSVETMVATALERCMHDIRQAPAAGWKCIDCNCIIWQQGDTDIGWMLHEGTLQRISGQYDAQNNAWHKRTTSKAASNIKECTFGADYNESFVRGIAIAITSNAGPRMQSYVQLRNREIV